MHIYSVTDPEFKPYGKILEGYDTAELCAAMEAIPLPNGTAYEPGIDSLEACAVFADFRDRAYIGFSRDRSGDLVFPSLSEFSTVSCDPHSQRL